MRFPPNLRGAGTFGRNRSAVTVLSAVAVALGAQQARGQIHWKSGTVETVQKSPAELSAALTRLAARPGENHVVVQFNRPMTRATRQALQAGGLQLQDYLGSNAFYALILPESLDAQALSQIGSFKDVLAVERSWKLHPMLAGLEVPDYAIVPPPEEGSDDPNPVVGVYVLFHEDVALRPDAAELVEGYGGWIRSDLESINGMVVELPLLEIGPLADQDAVQYVTIPLPRFSEVNDSNRWRTQADEVQTAPYGLTGAGVCVLVYDGGYAKHDHPDLTGRLTVRDNSGLSDHSTHVSGTIGGDGSASGGTWRGMAPAVTMESYGFQYTGPGIFLYSNPGDIENDYSAAISDYYVHISNNSIGTNTAINGFDCDITGDYGPTSELIDTIVRGDGGNPLFTSPFRVIWANGNERQTSRCGDLYYTTAPPACAKNHITVGALNSNDDSVTYFTSWGPTDDGRLKPDISAPGCQSGGDGGVTSCSSYGGYTVKCGTSMACPTVCGISALLLEDFRVQFPGMPDPRNSTLKVLLAHNAADVENTGPDYKTGYGSVRIKDTIDFMRTGNFLEASVADTDDSYSMLVHVEAGDPVFKATLAWDDVPGAAYTTDALVNDLDLIVYDPQGGRHYPWTLDPNNPSAPAVQTEEDHDNNIEQVLVSSPLAGVWQVEVYGTNIAVPGAEGQSFSLAASPTLVNCSPAGITDLDQVTYPCESTAEIMVVDCDLNTDSGVIETVTVDLASDSEPAGEPVVLTETAAETADFRGSIPTSAADAAGVLWVSHGDTVTATYIDADDGQGGTNVVVTDTGVVDCQAPQISNVQETDLDYESAAIVFDTSEPALGTVRYGASCAALDNQVSDDDSVTTHSIPITGLSDNTLYYYVVDAEDAVGNAATEDNGGLCFYFVTTEIPIYFAEQFSGDHDLEGVSLRFVPNATVHQYSGCAGPISELPTDPAGGTPLTSWTGNARNGYAAISLTGGQEVRLYGVNYTNFYVGTNGYLTFTAGDTAYGETWGTHFGMPRISGLFDDLDPGSGGTVSYRQLPDRVAVTWENVPEYADTGANTFQIEMYFDGQITISHLSVDSTDLITGLSDGGGESPVFVEMDLSEMGACLPMPPTAYPGDYETYYATPLPIVLQANDDGRPDPPAALSYVITALPAEVLRDAGDGHIIGAGELPYTLAAGGNQVIYEPGPYFLGRDGFEFKVNDGGTPPDGGDSNLAPVTILVTMDPWLQYSFPLDSDPGWTAEGQWAFGQPTGGGSHNGDPTGGHTGDNVYGYNLEGDYANEMPVYYLTSEAMDCSGLLLVELRFWKWLGVEAFPFDRAVVQASNNGSDWTTVWEHTGLDESDTGWSQTVLDISAVADYQPTVYIRWGMGPTDYTRTFPGWNIDDVEIWSVRPLCGEVLGDFDQDCDVDLNDFATFAACFHGAAVTVPPAGCTPEQFTETDLDGDGDVDLADFSTFSLVFTG